jgi:hypothetical protein
MTRVAVVYLDRYANPPGYARCFLRSLQRFAPGYPYDLVIQHKGYPVGSCAPRLRCGINGVTTEHLHYGEDWYQFGMARDTALRLDHDYLLFFVSWSRVVADGWLRIFLDAFAADSTCGLVGATGSFEGTGPEAPFPNPNIRTNAFMLRRDLFLSLDFGDTTTHGSGYAFEAGSNSLTRQVVARGLVPMVVGRDGGRWTPDGWQASRTFRSGHQENLLVADNRTLDFATARPKRRRKLIQLAWGTTGDLIAAGQLRRWRAGLAWRWPIAVGNLLWR